MFIAAGVQGTPVKNQGSARGIPKFGLARALSKLGYCSRSRAFDLIHARRVRLNGTPRLDPKTPVNLERDRIEVDGKPVAAQAKLYLMLNKPRGLVTTVADEKGRETIYSCLPVGLGWMAPVGRLDKASEGLLLLTNDSAWSARAYWRRSPISTRFITCRLGPLLTMR